jgi:hypothetical protein
LQLHAGFLLGLFFDHENGVDMFLRRRKNLDYLNIIHLKMLSAYLFIDDILGRTMESVADTCGKSKRNKTGYLRELPGPNDEDRRHFDL